MMSPELEVPGFVAENGPEVDDWARDRDREMLEEHRGTYLHEVPAIGEFRDEDAEKVALLMRRNRDEAAAVVPELRDPELFQRLWGEPTAVTADGQKSLDPELIEQALLGLALHKLDGKPENSTFHPRSHVELQLNDGDEAWRKRLAIAFAAPETERRQGLEVTFKRALVYDRSKPEGHRFYMQERSRRISMIDTDEHPAADNIDMVQDPEPASTETLLRTIRLLAESNMARPEDETPQETE